MANQDHINRLKQGVEVWNRWRQEHQELQPDLSEADLSRTILRGINLSGAVLTNATLTGADLRRAKLDEADLRFATLTNATLTGAELRQARLYRAKLINANLRNANLRGADLSEADLSFADLGEADLSEADLSEAFLKETNLSGTNLRFNVFFSYARQDRALRDKLEDHMSILKYRGFITTWHAREVLAGQNITEEVTHFLKKSRIILLLISASFMASSYCYSKEMMYALQRHERGTANVLPILLRPVLFTDAPFAKLKILPANGKPVTNWQDRENAFVEIALEIERLIVALKSPPIRGVRSGGSSKGRLVADRSKEEYYTNALDRSKQELLSGNSDIALYRGMAEALTGLGRYEESVEVLKQAIALVPQPALYMSIGNTFSKLGHYDQAIDSYQRAIALEETYAPAYWEIGEVLVHLGRQKEANLAYQQARRLDSGE